MGKLGAFGTGPNSKFRRDQDVAWGFIFVVLNFVITRILTSTPIDWQRMSVIAQVLIGLSIGATMGLVALRLARRWAYYRHHRRFVRLDRKERT